MGGFADLAHAFVWLGHEMAQSTVGLSARIAVAGLLFVGALHKFRHPVSAAAAAVSFGVLRKATRIGGFAIGTLELATACLLVMWFTPGAIAGSGLSLALSAGFVVVISAALARGERFPCNCLSASDEELSVATLMRAVAMAAASLLGGVSLIDSSVNTPYPRPELAVASVGIAAVAIGLPMTASLGLHLRRERRSYLKAIDWDWVMSLHRQSTYLNTSTKG
jgi:hypothetical protein